MIVPFEFSTSIVRVGPSSDASTNTFFLAFFAGSMRVGESVAVFAGQGSPSMLSAKRAEAGVAAFVVLPLDILQDCIVKARNIAAIQYVVFIGLILNRTPMTFIVTYWIGIFCSHRNKDRLVCIGMCIALVQGL